MGSTTSEIKWSFNPHQFLTPIPSRTIILFRFFSSHRSLPSFRAPDLGHDLVSVNLLVSKHRAQEDELSVRDAHLKTVNQVGETLISQEHFGSDKIRERIDEIGGMMGALQELAAFRKKRLHEAVDFYQFFADADGQYRRENAWRNEFVCLLDRNECSPDNVPSLAFRWWKR